MDLISNQVYAGSSPAIRATKMSAEIETAKKIVSIIITCKILYPSIEIRRMSVHSNMIEFLELALTLENKLFIEPFVHAGDPQMIYLGRQDSFVKYDMKTKKWTIVSW